MTGQGKTIGVEWRIREKISDILIHSHFPPFFLLCFVILLILFSLDIVTTDLVLNQGGYEKNIIMANIVHFPILHLLLKWLVLIFVLTIARIAENAIRGTGTLALAIVIGWYGVVITNNIHVLLSV